MEGQRGVGKRTYKDSVFVDYFSDDQTAAGNFLSVYNALHGTSFDDTSMVKPLRLRQVLYKAYYNDVSYLIDNRMIVLVEHQSTINPNMPLRCLEYVVRLYEQLLDSRERYARRLVSIPSPEFYVFYNGRAAYPTERELRLSDAFMSKGGEQALELRVRVLNINQQQGHEIVRRSRALEEYSRFVEMVRQYSGQEGGFERAIGTCIRRGILAEYLKRKGSEVINMLLAEYDYEEDIAVQRAEERTIAYGEGRTEGLAEGKSLGLAEGKRETAQLMKRARCDIAFIAQMTGLSAEDIAALGS